jgi:hypothetical protein
MPPDRALRRLIARLAELQEVDRLAILGGLTAEEAAQVQSLIGDYNGVDHESEAPIAPSRWAGRGLSPSLVQRLDGAAGGLQIPVAGGSADGADDLTPLTLATLRRLAGDLEPAPEALPAGSQTPRPGLLTRLGILGRRW